MKICKKTFIIFIIISTMMINISCNNSTSNTNSQFDISSPQNQKPTKVTSFEDGSRLETYVIVEDNSKSDSKIKGSKLVRHTNSNGNINFAIQLYGTYEHNESILICKEASYSYALYKNWHLKEESATKKGNHVAVTLTCEKKILGIVTSTVTVSVLLSYDENGNLY